MRWALSGKVPSQHLLPAWHLLRQSPSSLTSGKSCPQAGIAPGRPYRKSRMRVISRAA